MGFCLLNNVAVAAAEARAAGVERVAIVDWDVHHGNGTEEAFYDDPSVLVLSLHQDAFYPGTGQLERTGEGRGRGYNLNVPLSAGAGDDVYRAAFDRIVVPVLDRFAPQLVLVSAGFDAHARDPLAGMQLSDRCFSYMAARLGEVARTHAGGRIGLVLEGGYDLEGLERSLAASLRAVVKPVEPLRAQPSSLGMTHARELDAALEVARRHFDV
jgi:acetoin utilization deacetylase AcuC-like enzyme